MEIAGTGMRVKVPVEEVPPGTTQAFAARKGDGKGGAHKAKPVGKPIERPIANRTEVNVANFFKNMKKDKNWKFHREYKGKPSYINKVTKEIRYGDMTPNYSEIECFTKKGKHIVLNPVTGEKILSKCGKHKLPDCLK
jgi:hypothetical protein